VIAIKCGIFNKMKIPDRINMIDRIQSSIAYSAYPVYYVKRYD